MSRSRQIDLEREHVAVQHDHTRGSRLELVRSTPFRFGRSYATAMSLAVSLSLSGALSSGVNADSLAKEDDASDSIIASDANLDETDPQSAQPSAMGADEDSDQTLVVTATAYNSLAGQTDSDPTTAAWGDSLAPGMKVIAVSRDLIPLGLDHQAPVSIEGFPGKFRVLDKMNRRWSKRIDIYMGNDRSAALEWGSREVRIHW